MSLLLIGLLALFGALRARHSRTTPKWAGLVVMAMGLVAMGQLWIARDHLNGYRIEVLGPRFFSDPEAPEPLQWTVSGDRGLADLHVPGLGPEPVATVSILRGESSQLVLMDADGAGGVAMVRSLVDHDWQVLGSVALESGDRVVLRSSGRRDSLLIVRDVSTLSRVGMTGGQDWVIGEGVPEGSARVALPFPRGEGVFGFFPTRPNVFQRSYPLADLGPLLDAPGWEGVRSFLYYRRGELRIALLDADVSVVGASGRKTGFSEAVVWSEGDSPKRGLFASLPLRDFPEDGLELPERYGVRVLRTVAFSVEDDWVSALRPRSEVYWLDLTDGRPAIRGATGDAGPSHRLRIGVGAAAADVGNLGLVLTSMSDRFGTAGEAILQLPDKATAGAFEILTPSGLATAQTGVPLTLEDGRRGILMRVDGLGMTGGLALLLLALFVLGAAAFWTVPSSGLIASVSLLAAGMASMRLLLSVSAMARFPFVLEGHQISLWMIAGLPWVLLVLGSFGRKSEERNLPGVALVPRGFSGGFMGAVEEGGEPSRTTRHLKGSRVGEVVTGVLVVTLALILFPDSQAKAAVLGGLVMALLGWRFLGKRFWGIDLMGKLRASFVQRLQWVRPLVAGGWNHAWLGVGLGVGFLFLRVAGDLIGFREQISVAGVRIGLSVLYTPVSMVAFAMILFRQDQRLSRRAAEPGASRRFVLAWVDLCAFLFLAFGLVGVWISDFGIVLTTLPGPLMVLAWWGLRHSRRHGTGAALAGCLPLILFASLQVAPSMVLSGGSFDEGEGAALGGWSRNELLLLERGDPEALELIGESRSEALGVMRETMRSYTRRNWLGRGFLQGRVSPEIRATATREHLVSGLLVSQWGFAGVVGLSAIMMGFIALGVGSLRPPSLGGVVSLRLVASLGALLVLPGLLLPASSALIVTGLGLMGALAVPLIPFVHGLPPKLAGLWPSDENDTEDPGGIGALGGVVASALLIGIGAAGAYMILANYGLVLFTGKNVYLLGLDSLGDALESLALLGLAVLATGGKNWAVGEDGDVAEEKKDEPSREPGPALLGAPVVTQGGAV